MIEVTTQQDAAVEVHVLPGGEMECTVAGTLLWPTPEWLCRAVAVQTGKQELQDPEEGPAGAAAEERLYSAGVAVLREMAPVCLVLTFDALHAKEGAAS